MFLNHGIAYSAKYQRRGPSFVDRYVFPDGELVPINTTLHAAEDAGFEVRDVESLREHYALTLHQWGQRLEANAEQARRIADVTTYRIWRLYMASSAHAFRSGRLNLYQSLLTTYRVTFAPRSSTAPVQNRPAQDQKTPSGGAVTRTDGARPTEQVSKKERAAGVARKAADEAKAAAKKAKQGNRHTPAPKNQDQGESNNRDESNNRED